MVTLQKPPHQETTTTTLPHHHIHAKEGKHHPHHSSQPHADDLGGKMWAGWDSFTGWIGETIVEPVEDTVAGNILPVASVVGGVIFIYGLYVMTSGGRVTYRRV